MNTFSRCIPKPNDGVTENAKLPHISMSVHNRAVDPLPRQKKAA